MRYIDVPKKQPWNRSVTHSSTMQRCPSFLLFLQLVTCLLCCHAKLAAVDHKFLPTLSYLMPSLLFVDKELISYSHWVLGFFFSHAHWWEALGFFSNFKGLCCFRLREVTEVSSNYLQVNETYLIHFSYSIYKTLSFSFPGSIMPH